MKKERVIILLIVSIFVCSLSIGHATEAEFNEANAYKKALTILAEQNNVSEAYLESITERSVSYFKEIWRDWQYVPAPHYRVYFQLLWDGMIPPEYRAYSLEVPVAYINIFDDGSYELSRAAESFIQKTEDFYIGFEACNQISESTDRMIHENGPVLTWDYERIAKYEELYNVYPETYYRLGSTDIRYIMPGDDALEAAEAADIANRLIGEVFNDNVDRYWTNPWFAFFPNRKKSDNAISKTEDYYWIVRLIGEQNMAYRTYYIVCLLQDGTVDYAQKVDAQNVPEAEWCAQWNEIRIPR